jgi:hypothetical protein
MSSHPGRRIDKPDKSFQEKKTEFLTGGRGGRREIEKSKSLLSLRPSV